MSAPSSRYLDHLRQGLAAYEQRTGRRPADEALDVSRPAVRALYDRFRARPFPTGLGATEAEWLMLDLGLKQVLRERLSAARLPALKERCAAEGWALEVQALDPPGSQAPVVDGADTSPLRGFHAYVGRERGLVAEAAALDHAMIPHQSAPEEHIEGTSPDDTLRLGELLGYPPCCTAAFAQFHDHLVDNWQPIATAAAATRRFEPLLNNLVLGAFHFIAWYPCSYDCAASLQIAHQLSDELAKRRPAETVRAHALLSTPRVYFDERRQLILDGVEAEGHVRYSAVHSPYALDRQASSAAYEWVFFADVVAPLERGDRLWMEGEELVAAHGGRELVRLAAPDAIWLPFTR
ncbi:MAG: hypothetical protein KDA24_15610 [Deltaproteobacteria bacterium]|nr:hypothetical protein [Deltaproteobacteria bacterium]